MKIYIKINKGQRLKNVSIQKGLKVTAKVKKTKGLMQNVFSIQKGFLKVTAKVKKTKRPYAKVFSIQKWGS